MRSQASYWVRFKSFLKECKRVLTVTKKPNLEEFKTVTKITGLGMLLIGIIGFVISTAGLLLGI